MNSYPKSLSMIPFLMVFGVSLGILFSVALGSVVVGLPFGLCASFLSGIVYCRTMQLIGGAGVK